MLTEQDFRQMGYQNIRTLPTGKVCATFEYIFTTGLVIGLNDHGIERRYCYDKGPAAAKALAEWDGAGDPPGDWIKEKPSGRRGPGAPAHVKDESVEPAA